MPGRDAVRLIVARRVHLRRQRKPAHHDREAAQAIPVANLRAYHIVETEDWLARIKGGNTDAKHAHFSHRGGDCHRGWHVFLRHQQAHPSARDTASNKFAGAKDAKLAEVAVIWTMTTSRAPHHAGFRFEAVPAACAPLRRPPSGR